MVEGRYGSAIGRAVHAVLQVIDLTSGAGLGEAVLAQSMAEGVRGQEPLVRALVDSALASDLVRRPAAREHWHETYVGTLRRRHRARRPYRPGLPRRRAL